MLISALKELSRYIRFIELLLPQEVRVSGQWVIIVCVSIWGVNEKEFDGYPMGQNKHQLSTISGYILKILKHQQSSFQSYWCL